MFIQRNIVTLASCSLPFGRLTATQNSVLLFWSELISIQSLSSSSLKVIGAPGATKGNAEVKVASGFLNSKTVIANPDGSFEVVLNYFTSAKVIATDLVSGRSESAQINYDVDTTLAGTIKDTDGLPLAGVKVIIKNTDTAPVMTNASGIFSFSNPPTGDQQLIIDAQNVPVEAVGPNKKFSVMEMPVSIGTKQSNVISNPIYLAPLRYDGTETAITAGVSTVVETAHVQGASIEIPGNVQVNFPEGNTLNAINMAEVVKDKTTVPVLKNVEPQSVVALEPSGLSFSEPVKLTLPNTNEFPSGMQLIIYSKNSKTGRWEIDGLAKVNDMGDQIVTQDGAGITHFSEVYAAPMGLKYSQINSQDKPGADTFNGAVSTSIDFPGYKSLGTEIAPKLLYRSNWAHPTATVTNIFQIPSEVMFINSYGERVLAKSTTDAEIQNSFKTWVVPESVDITFRAGDYLSPKMSLTGLPSKAVVSYGMDFLNQKSGVLPFSSDYEIHLKRMIVRSKFEGGNGLIGALLGSSGNTYSTEEIVTSEIMPASLKGNLYIQNKANSNVGRGWMIGGVQKIINPSNSRLMLEEDNGAVSTYVVNDKIQTIKKLSEGFSGLELDELNNAIVSTGNDSIISLDLDTGTSNNLFVAPKYTGNFSSTISYYRNECETWVKSKFIGRMCINRQSNLYCIQRSANYQLKPTRKYVIRSPRNNNAYILASENGVITEEGGSSLLLTGGLKSAPTGDSDTYFCGSTASCSGHRNLNDFKSFSCPPSPASSGLVYDQGFADGGLSNARFNTIKSIASSQTTNGFAVADYGNHRVRFVNLDTQIVSTIAGTGKIEESGEGGLATEASLYHPLGLVYDSNGNLYISTENGYIKKIDTSGKITKIAGNPNGVYYEYGNALDLYLVRPYGLALDEEKNYLYVADSGNNRVLRIDLITKIAKNVAGSGTCQTENPSTENGSALNASLCTPEFISLDDNKNLVIADTGHKMIRRVIFSDSASGILKFDSVADDGSSLIRNLDGAFVRTFRSGVKINFDKFGKHTASQDRLGRTTSNLYDIEGKLVQQTDPIGGSIFYEYSMGLLQTIRYGVDGRQFTFNYDFRNNLTSVNYPDGTVKQFDYANDGLLLKEIDQKNNALTYTYNEWKRLQSVTRPDGKSITINDSQSGNMANNFSGGVIGTFKTPGTGAGQLEDGIKDAKGITTSFIQDESGYVSTIIDGDSKVTKVERDFKGRPIKITRPDLSTVEFVFDQKTGDLLSKSDSATNTSENYSYDLYGNLLSKTDGQGRKISNLYDEKGQLLKTTNEILGTSVSYNYNSLGLLISQTDSMGNNSSVTYNERGNVSQSQSPEGKFTNFVYYPSGLVQKVLDANSTSSIYEYDNMNKLLAVTSGGNQKTQYTYQETGELIQTIDPYNRVTNFYYNSLGLLVKKVGTRGEITELAYDENGNTIQEKTPNGSLKYFYYDNLNRLVRKLLPDDDYKFSYDIRGNVTSVRNLQTQIDLSYQHFDGGDVISQTHAFGIGNRTDLPNTSISYNYNDAGEKIAMITPKGTFQYVRDAAGRLKSITNHKGEIFNMKYDLNQRLKEIATPVSVTNFNFDSSGFNTQIEFKKKSGALIERFIYGKDEVGNRISKSSNAGTSSYEYDKNYQLIKSIAPNLPAESFAYDSLGNRISDSNSTYVFDQTKQLIQEDYKYLYSFDQNGNLTSKQEKGFTGNVENYDYTSENQMRSYKLYKNGQLAREVTYTFDALGRRIEKDIIDHEDSSKSYTKRFAYDGLEILFEFDEANSITKTYTHSTLRTDDVLAVANTQGSFYFVKDGLGTVTDIVDNGGAKKVHLEYSAFGIILSVTDENGVDVSANPPAEIDFAFTGRELDSESGGLYHYRARAYDPNIGRFLQTDPDTGRMSNPITHINKYSYVRNNPLNFTDPMGLDFLGIGNFYKKNENWIVGGAMVTGAIAITVFAPEFAVTPVGQAAVGALIGGGASAFANKNPNNLWKDIRNGAAVGAVTGVVGGQVSNLFTGGLTSASSGTAVVAANVGGGVVGGVVGVNTAELLVNNRLATKGENMLAAGTGLLWGLGSAIKTIVNTSAVQSQGVGSSALPANDSPQPSTSHGCTVTGDYAGNCK